MHSIGLERMRAWPTMKALTYNLTRLEALIRLGKAPIDGIRCARMMGNAWIGSQRRPFGAIKTQKSPRN